MPDNIKLQFDFFSFIITIGVIQGFILAAILLQFTNKKKANLYLFLFVLSATISISVEILYKTNLFLFVPHMIRYNEPFRFLIAPFFYFYVKSIITINFKFKKQYYLHFIPFILNIIYMIPFFIKSGKYKIQYIIDQKYLNINRLVFENQVFLFLILISIIIYIIIINIIIKQHEKNIKETFSSIDKINLAWLKKFLLFFLLVIIICFVLLLIGSIKDIAKELLRFIPVIVGIAIYGLAYRAIKQPEIFRPNISTEKILDKPIDDEVKLKRLVISTDKINEYYNKLLTYMEKEKPYLNEELTLYELAEKLEITQRQLSDVINEKSGSNFYFFINKYRVEEAKILFKKLKDKDISVLDIAFDAGFNSKATFNSMFKQFTKMTPTQYKKTI